MGFGASDVLKWSPSVYLSLPYNSIKLNVKACCIMRFSSMVGLAHNYDKEVIAMWYNKLSVLFLWESFIGFL